MAELSLAVLLRSAFSPTPVLKPPMTLLRRTLIPRGGVSVTSGIAEKRESAQGRIPFASRETKQRVLPLRRIEIGIASIRRWGDRFRFWQKRKADYDECDANRII